MANLFHRRILININLPPPPNDKFVQDPIIQESLSSPTAARLMTDRSGRGDRRDRDRRRDEEKRGRSRDRRAKKTNRSRDRERRGRDEETDRSRSSKPVLVPAQAAPAPAPSAEAAAPGEAEATEPPSHDDEEGEESEDCVMDPTVSVDDLRPVKHAVPEAGEAARPGPAKAETSTRTTTTHKRSGGPPQPHQGETKRDHGHKTGEKRAQGHKPGEKRDQGHEKRDQGHKPGVKRDQVTNRSRSAKTSLTKVTRLTKVRSLRVRPTTTRLVGMNAVSATAWSEVELPARGNIAGHLTI